MLARRALQRPHSPLISFCRLLHKKRPYSYKKFKKSDFMAELGQEDQVVLISGEILYGYYPVLLALEARRRRFHALYYNPDGEEKVRRLAEAAASRGVPTRPTDSASLSEMAARSDKVRGVHQGVCADVDRLSLERIPDDVEDDDASRPLLWLLLCGLRDPMNLGAVIRSAYYLGVDRVITTTEFPSSSPTPGTCIIPIVFLLCLSFSNQTIFTLSFCQCNFFNTILKFLAHFRRNLISLRGYKYLVKDR